MDDLLITHYDRSTRRVQPQVPWVEKAEDGSFWEQETHHARDAEQFSRQAVLILKSRYNQTGGLHTWQCLVGCELSKDRKQKGRSMQCGYDGRDFISLDKETFTWTAADDQAQLTKRKWEADSTIVGIWKSYLEKICIERLQKYLNYEKEILLRIEPPMAKITHKVGHDGLETLICQVYGFYPKEIDATWRKDGEVWEQDTFRRGVTPNSDGTYYTWLSIDIYPKDTDRYRCHVEHDGLLEPLVLTWEKPALVPLKAFLGTMAAIVLVTGIIFSIKKWQRKSIFTAVPVPDQGPDTFPVEKHQQNASGASPSAGGPQQQEERMSLLQKQTIADHLLSKNVALHHSVPKGGNTILIAKKKAAARATWPGPHRVHVRRRPAPNMAAGPPGEG
ncbi:class I histocompatibility antigen, F10 alpha chain-like [Hemicordylus capensis]|uniref:class I histocompatibility antigen, F10 alpha chain-like n=1 Tax=Hemicordylus capensis TaxID=884348 RepID=UPI0023029521|nr:class I histocompatibility antigen, F10 alpha chain-like [Hemicordylus capensis]XP_053145499.1 class I histocompatibility antigen, F10 alpha chain-like [Hemicordylus capensis]